MIKTKDTDDCMSGAVFVISNAAVLSWHLQQIVIIFQLATPIIFRCKKVK